MNKSCLNAENEMYMKNKKYLMPFLYLLFHFFIVSQAYTEVTFGGIDMYTPNNTLFSASVDLPGDARIDSYKTLFEAELDTKMMQQLTIFPERVLFLEEKNIIQIYNRFGVFRSDTTLKRFQPVLEFPSFVNGSQVSTGKISGTLSSPAGSHLVYMVPESTAYGKLVLLDLSDNRETVISEGVEFSYSSPKVIWSDDSQILIYEKKGNLYYYTHDKSLPGGMISESFRKIGSGRINSAVWSGDSLYFLKDSFIFKIRSSEIFTTSLYSDVIDTGEVRGRIPVPYDPNFDDFWISPAGDQVVICKDGRNLFFFHLDRDVFFNLSNAESRPHMHLPRNSRVKKLVWGSDGMVTVLTETIVNGLKESAVFRLDTAEQTGEPVFRRIMENNVTDIVLSGNNQRVAVVKANNVSIKWYRSWGTIRDYDFDTPMHMIWINDEDIVIFGKYLTELRRLRTDERDVLTVSQPVSYGFNSEIKSIMCESGGRFFSWDGSGRWVESRKRDYAPDKNSSELYRVYTEKIIGGSYNNMVFVRDINSYTTETLFSGPLLQYDLMPETEEPVDYRNFTRGSRIRGRYVSFVFNAVKDDAGLTDILGLLSDYNIKSTFFVSGDFIKRHPGAVKEIADSGHENGSLFYYYFNLTDARYKVDSDFIVKGLARNEDEYYKTTGKELSLLWHAPYYFINSRLIAAAEKMNYTYIGRDVIVLDRKSERDANFGTSQFYKPAADLAEEIFMLKKPGSIIPITIGKTEYGREDYIYQYLEILINNLIAAGYEIIPVTTLMERSR